jgi:membrane-associated phospholipid phosphatase
MASVAVPRRSIGSVRDIVGRGAAGRLALGAASLALFLFLVLDALTRPSAAYDLWAMQAIQRPDTPTFSMLLVKVERLTDSMGAVVAWLAVLGVAVALRRWAWACVVALVPSGGVANFVVADVIARARPHLDGTIRSSQNFEDRSFPSGHAMGAMMLYGLVFAAAGEVRSPVLRVAIRAACVAVIVASGLYAFNRENRRRAEPIAQTSAIEGP